MPGLFSRFEQFLNNEKNFYVIYFVLVVFLFSVKFPSILSSDIQPWDEGMYATRVLSIHVNGDFIDQSTHSVGGFYSASHPPMLIWIGYAATMMFGLNEVTFKLVIFAFSLLTLFLIMLMGRMMFNGMTAFVAAMIFSCSILFEVFSQRFQFDIPCLFFIVLSFYFFIRYKNAGLKKYLIYSGIAFGLCLMTKILVGFLVPIVLMLTSVAVKDKSRFNLKNVMTVFITGMVIALPWHIYMIFVHGKEFSDYFFGFHLYQRAMVGVEQNEKGSGFFYHINYILSILPFGIIILFAFLKDLKIFRELKQEKIFLWIWFLTGLIIISLFKTKLQSYLLLILVPVCFIIPLYLEEVNGESRFTKAMLIFLTLLNGIWFGTEFMRPDIKKFMTGSDMIIHMLIIISALAILFYLSKMSTDRIELKKTFYLFIFVFFLANNLNYLVNVPKWVGFFKLSEISRIAAGSNRNKIVYIGTNHRFNPQFSYYFKGANLNWDKSGFEYELIDNKDGTSQTKDKLRNLKRGEYLYIVEKDDLSRANYDSSALFIPGDAKMLIKSNGYELYEN